MAGNGNGITERLVDYTLSLKYEDIPPEVIERTKQLFLDFLGGAVGGRTLAESNTAVVHGAAAIAADTPGACTVLGEPRQFPPHLAALLNGTFAHSMDFDDTHKEAVTHPGTPLFATLLAVAEQTGASGRDLLTAAIAGYDVGCKLAMLHSDRVHMRGFHPTATTGIFACTMAAGRLLGLSREALLNAVALNLSQAAGSVQFSETGGANKPLQVGLTAHNALYSLTFAQAGFQGNARPLEGKFGYFMAYAGQGLDPDQAAADLGERFEVMHTAVKPYPCCRYNHPVIDGVLDIMERDTLAAHDVQGIDVTISNAGYNLVADPPESKRKPAGTVDGQFSVYFAAAVAALDRSYGWSSYDRLHDPQVLDMMDRVAVRASTDVANLSAAVSLATRDGRAHDMDVAFARGEPERPLGWEELEDKFNDLWSQGQGMASSAAVLAQVRALDDVDDIPAFTRALRA